MNTWGTNDYFPPYSREVSLGVIMTLATVLQHNRGYCHHLNIVRLDQLNFDHINNGACGLFAYVYAKVYNELKADEEEEFKVVGFPAGFGDNGGHAMVKYGDTLIDGSLAMYKAEGKLIARKSSYDVTVFTITPPGDQAQFKSGAFVAAPDSRIVKNWCRGSWFPWSTMRSNRIVRSIVKGIRNAERRT